jgi:hypothetical protein
MERTIYKVFAISALRPILSSLLSSFVSRPNLKLGWKKILQTPSVKLILIDHVL